MARLEARGICQGIRAFLVQMTRPPVQRQLCPAITKNYCRRWLPGPAGAGAGLPVPWPTAGRALFQRALREAAAHQHSHDPLREPCCHLPPHARALQAHGMCRQKRAPGLCELHEFCQPEKSPSCVDPAAEDRAGV